MKTWHNAHTQLCFHALVEEWSGLEALARHAKDPADLAVKIHDSYAQAFDLISTPFLRFACLRALRQVNFCQVAEQLLLMLGKQWQHQANRSQET